MIRRRHLYVMNRLQLNLSSPPQFLSQYTPAVTTTTSIEIKEEDHGLGMPELEPILGGGKGDVKSQTSDSGGSGETKRSWIDIKSTSTKTDGVVKAESSSRGPGTSEEKSLYQFLRAVASSTRKNMSALWVAPLDGSVELGKTNFEKDWSFFVSDDVVGAMEEAITYMRLNCTNATIRRLNLAEILQSRTLRTALAGLVKGHYMRQDYTKQMSRGAGFTASLSARNSNEYNQQIKGHMNTLNRARWNSAIGDYT